MDQFIHSLRMITPYEMIQAPDALLASPKSFNAWHIGAFLLFAAIINGVSSSLFFAWINELVSE